MFMNHRLYCWTYERSLCYHTGHKVKVSAKYLIRIIKSNIIGRNALISKHYPTQAVIFIYVSIQPRVFFFIQSSLSHWRNWRHILSGLACARVPYELVRTLCVCVCVQVRIRPPPCSVRVTQCVWLADVNYRFLKQTKTFCKKIGFLNRAANL